ncbi:MAG: response regulator [Gammaproteobacteria bacterium]|nr:response regulator [Gammaproteobacteria bacterium]
MALKMLERLGHETTLAKSGLEVLAALQADDFDVVLMDVHMPDLDGLETSRRIRSRYPRESPWIIAMTANAMHGDRDACMAAGMNDYLAKPVSIAALQHALAAAHKQPAAPTPASQSDSRQHI